MIRPIPAKQKAWCQKEKEGAAPAAPSLHRLECPYQNEGPNETENLPARSGRFRGNA
jgi:hypothetical protein